MELFGVGIGEAGLVLLIALLLVGPERFPQIAREGGKWYRMARRFTAEVTADLQGALKELEDEVNEQSGDLKSVREIGDELRTGMRETSQDLTAIGQGVGAAASDADLAKPGAPADTGAAEAGLGVVQSSPDMFARVRASYSDYHAPEAPAASEAPATPSVPQTEPDIDPDAMAQHAAEAFEQFQKPAAVAVVSGGNPFGEPATSPAAAPTEVAPAPGDDAGEPAATAPASPPANGVATPSPTPAATRGAPAREAPVREDV